MNPAESLLVAVLYGYVFYFLARGTVTRLMDIDEEYRDRWSRPGWSANSSNSFAILHIMFNMNLPKSAHPTSLRRRIWIARVMMWLWPFVLFVAFFIDMR